MKRSDAIEDRVRALFDAARFYVVTGPADVLVEETEKEGFARITCRVGAGHRAIVWKLQTGDLRPIASEKNADGAILVIRSDGSLEAHVMECKQTVDSSTWRKALLQLEWTLVRLLAIAGALHERIERVTLYTAFFRNVLESSASADMSLYELPLDGQDNSMMKRERPMMRGDTEVNIELPGWTSSFLHVKVRKDRDGLAAVDLRIGPQAQKS